MDQSSITNIGITDGVPSLSLELRVPLPPSESGLTVGRSPRVPLGVIDRPVDCDVATGRSLAGHGGSALGAELEALGVLDADGPVHDQTVRLAVDNLDGDLLALEQQWPVELDDDGFALRPGAGGVRAGGAAHADGAVLFGGDVVASEERGVVVGGVERLVGGDVVGVPGLAGFARVVRIIARGYSLRDSRTQSATGPTISSATD